MSLKRALDRPDSPLRRFVDARLPHGDDARAPWGAALRQVRPVPLTELRRVIDVYARLGLMPARKAFQSVHWARP